MAPEPSAFARRPTGDRVRYAQGTRSPDGVQTRRLRYESRVRLSLLVFCLVPVTLSGLLTWVLTSSLWATTATVLLLGLVAAIAAFALFDQLIRPLQTITNIIVSLREGDLTLRARGAGRGDTLGDLAMETNLLAATLQQQRTQARDAVTLAERVITAMPLPVLAFDASGRFRLMNRAAEQLFDVSRAEAARGTAKSRGLRGLLDVPDGGIFVARRDEPERAVDNAAPVSRWIVRRTAFRLDGLPHTLVVCSDVDAALREEERTAWQRLIRVLGHEINNSLTPISSIAGSLIARLPAAGVAAEADLHRGLHIIEDRAGSLHRFLAAYQRLSRLPVPSLQPTALMPLLERVVHLETRLAIRLTSDEPVRLLADPDQLQQMFINLVQNAVDAALQPGVPDLGDGPEVEVSWQTSATEVVVRIRDNGPGLANPNNLFVPFYTTKPQGSGIGLVLARQIVTAHRGAVTLSQRTDGHGCEALVHLPLG